MKLTTKARGHLVSGGMATIYALAFHLLYTAVFPIVYLIQGGAFGYMVMVHISVLLIGLIVFFILCCLPTERLTFYIVLMIAHILFSALFWLLSEPLLVPMIDRLQDAVGIELTGQPEENFDALYLFAAEVIMQIFVGLFYFLGMIVSIVRHALRAVMGDVRCNKNKEQPRL